MSKFKFASLAVFGTFLALALTANPALAQHGGGHSGGGSSHGGGGGGSHSSGGGGFHGGGGERMGGYGREGGGVSRGGPSYGGPRSSDPGNYSRGSAMESGRNLSASAGRSSNFRPAINDGQWHSFGNSAHSSAGHNSAAFSNLVARSAGNTNGNWHGFGSSREGSLRGVSNFNGGGFRPTGGFGFRGGCCWRPGFGGGFGFGLGFGSRGFRVGYPFWAFGWDPWWYNPYWYGPYWYAPTVYGYYPGYDGYLDYNEDWSNNPPPYRPGSWPTHDAGGSDLSAANY